ncbi:MAG: hypothetical protein V3S91_02505 [Gemmatimonadota bacterium]
MPQTTPKSVEFSPLIGFTQTLAQDPMVNGRACLSLGREEPFLIGRQLPEVNQHVCATLFAQRQPVLETGLLVLCPEDNSSEGQSIQIDVRAAQL